MIIGEDSQGLSIIVRLDSSIGKFYESGPGTRVIVADDISGSLFDPLRMVRVNLGRADVLKTVERKNLAIMR